MKFFSFVIMMVILEVLFLFYFKQTSSMVAMSVINIGALSCFFSKNWRNTPKTYKSLVISAFFIGNLFTLVRELLEGYEFSEIVYFGIILSALVTFFFTSAIAFPHLSGAPNNSLNSSHSFSPFNSEHVNSNLFDEEISDRLDTNPATGLSMSGCGSDCAGNMYGSGNYDIGGSLSSYSFDSSYDDSSLNSSSHYDNDFSTTSGFDHDDYSRRDS
ncbi:hypothetical protein [Arsenophonus sp.]|uniref:hypothetical protein n=1 Tax=Arsenophonus sp. TaxID=1872640 RepID=UPI0028634E72|nr:hypothetical protein [Arsenophonus sp.]MDR5614287.1 hypothetical protein [Arsenophonus sp.]